MTAYKSTLVRLGGLLIVFALFALGPPPAKAADSKKKNKTEAPVSAAKKGKQAKKKPKAPAGNNQAAKQGRAGQEHKGHSHAGAQGHAGHDDKKGRGHPGHGHAGHAREHGSAKKNPFRPLSASEKTGRNQLVALAGMKKGPMVDEQRKYALRTARLNRILQVAHETLDHKTAKLVYELLKKDKYRYRRKISKLRKTFFFQAKAAKFPLTGVRR